MGIHFLAHALPVEKKGLWEVVLLERYQANVMKFQDTITFGIFDCCQTSLSVELIKGRASNSFYGKYFILNRTISGRTAVEYNSISQKFLNLVGDKED